MQTQPRPQSSKAREKCPGDEVAANNHRPITVLPTISKILEKWSTPKYTVILGPMRLLLPNNLGLDLSYQRGQPWLISDNILQNMDTGSLKGAVFLDLSKSFDTVEHHLLLQKLTNTGLIFATTWS